MSGLPPTQDPSAWALNLDHRFEGPLNKRLFCGILARECRIFFDYDSILICFYDETLQRLIPVFGEDTPEDEVEPVDCVLDELVRGEVYPYARLTNREKPQLDPRLVPFGDETRPSMSLMYCPIYLRDNLVGTLSVQSYVPFKYSRADLDLLQELANQCGDALVRVRSEEQRLILSQAVEQSASMIMITDDQARIKFVNKRFQEVTGYTIDDVWGKNPKFLSAGNTSKNVYKMLWKLIKSGGTWRGEFCNQTKDGSIYWASANISPIHDEEGELTNYLSVQEDITASRDLGNQKEWSEAVLRAVSSAAEGFLRTTDWKQPVREFLGNLGEAAEADRVFIAKWQSGETASHLLRRFEWCRQGIGSREEDPPAQVPIFPEKDGHAQGHIREVHGPLAEAMRSPDLKSFIILPILVSSRSWGALGLEMCRSERKWAKGEIEVLRMAANTIGAAIQRTLTERALHESEELNRTMLSSVPLNCFLLDPFGVILAFNDLACKSLGCSREDAVGRSILDFGSEEENAPRVEWLELVRETKTSMQFDDEFGGRIYTNWVHPVLNTYGEVVRIAAFSVDTTDLKRSARLAVLGNSASAIAHHMKNIQMSINGARTVVEKAFNNEDLSLLKKVWPAIDRATGRVDQLIQNMLCLAREGDHLYKEEDLNEIVSEVVEDVMVAFRKSEINWEQDLDSNSLILPLSRAAVQDAVMNLLVNSAEAMLSDSCKAPQVTISTRAIGDCEVSIQITDNGPGLPMTGDRLFEPFFTTKGVQGTGIGLAVVKKVMAEHGGRIAVESPPGGGASFTLIFPSSRAYEGSIAAEDCSLGSQT